MAKRTVDYVARKRLHMERMGIPVDQDVATARPAWRKEEQEWQAKRRERWMERKYRRSQ